MKVEMVEIVNRCTNCTCTEFEMVEIVNTASVDALILALVLNWTEINTQET